MVKMKNLIGFLLTKNENEEKNPGRYYERVHILY